MSTRTNPKSYGNPMTTHTGAILLLLLATTLTGQTVSADPLCIAADERPVVESLLAESPAQSPAQIARSTGLTEAAIVHALPVDTRVPVALSELDSVWQKLSEWDDASLIVYSADGVFELFGSLPPAVSNKDYFEIGGPDDRYAGRLNIDRLAAIYLVSTYSNDLEVHQVAIFDQHGRRVLSVRVPQNTAGSLRSQPHNEFLRLKDAYGDISRRQLMTDLSCMWASKNAPGQSQADTQLP